jgi:hypothetical protein
MTPNDRIEQSNSAARRDAEPPAVVDRVDQDHHGLRSRVAALRLAASAAEPRPDDFADRVIELVALVGSHFQLEEESGMFIDITAQTPELGHRVQRLLDQHHELRRRFGDVVDRLMIGEDIAPALLEALDELMAHERAETQLIQDAYLTDLGRGD